MKTLIAALTVAAALAIQACTTHTPSAEEARGPRR